MNDNLDEKYVTYKTMNMAALIVMLIWFFNSCAIDKLNDKITELDKRLTRTKAICYGTGQSQPD